MSWYECTANTIGKIVNSGGISYICSNVNGTFMWKETFSLRLIMIALAFLFFLPAVLRKLGMFKVGKTKRTH